MAKKLKEDILKIYFWMRNLMSHLIDVVSPFMLIFAFVIILPTLKALSVRWLWVFCVFMVAMDIVFNQLEKVFQKEVSIGELIEKNKEMIGELNEDIKKLESIKREKEVKK